ncbi:MAG: hypothetical protein IJO69_07170 [Ruminiclostridium sp.]|nr:hypothetical protein [Ruminiclostridium sp.]MBQ9933593.1 hypothetical protein [Ruminiclostridium sp.]
MRNRVWKELPFSQGELEQAARIAGQAITDALPEDCSHTFSPEFQKKMDGLTQKTDRPGWTVGFRRAACFCLVFLVGGVAWFTVEAQMSQQTFGWDKETAPAVLYQEYETIIQEANETHDVELSLAPLEEMDPERMPTVTKFQHDVDEMVEAIQYIGQYQGGQVPERTFAQEFFRELFNLDRRIIGMGDRIVSETTDGYAAELGMIWNVEVNVVISTPTGPVDFYVQKIMDQEMTAGTMPAGYTVKAVGETWSQVSSDYRSCAVYRQFILTQNGVSATVVPWIVLEVNGETAAVTVSGEEDDEALRPRAVSGSIPAEAVGKDTRDALAHVIKTYLKGDFGAYCYISHEELWALGPEELTWEQEALQELSMDLYRDTGGVPSGYLYERDTAYTLEEWHGEQMALTEYELLRPADEGSDDPLYRMDHVLMVQGMQEWEWEIYGYGE